MFSNYSLSLNNIKVILDFLAKISLFALAFTLFYSDKHIAALNITLAFAICVALLTFLFNLKNSNIIIQKRFSWVGISCLLFLLCYLIAATLHSESAFYFLQRKHYFISLGLMMLYPASMSIRNSLYAILGLQLGLQIINFIAVYKVIEFLQINGNIGSFTVLHPLFIPMQMSHHILAIGNLNVALLTLYILWKHVKEIPAVSKYLLFIALAINCIMVNIIMARVGLLTFYLCVFILMGYFFSKAPLKWFYKLGIVFVLFTFLSAIMFSSPFLLNRVKETIDNYHQVKDMGSQVQLWNNFGTRIVAQRVGFAILKDNWWTGTGFSGENEKYVQYQAEYCKENQIENIHADRPYKPHNMFLRYTVIMGLPLGIVFTLSFVALFLIAFIPKFNLFYFLFIFVNFIYQWTDMPFESRGWYIHFFFLLWLWQLIKTKE